MTEAPQEYVRVQKKVWETFERVENEQAKKIDEKLQKLELSLAKAEEKEEFIRKMKKIFGDKKSEIKVENNRISIIMLEWANEDEISQIVDWIRIEGEKVWYDFNLDGKIDGDELIKSWNPEKIDENWIIWNFGRFYMSGWIENWDIPDQINNIQYHSYLLWDQSFTGRNLAITARNLSKTHEWAGWICFSDKKIVKTEDGKSYLVVIWESEERNKVHLDQNYKDLNDLLSKVRGKTATKTVDGKEVLWIEAWVTEISGADQQKQMNIYEAWEREVHQSIKVDFVDKWIDKENPIHLIKDSNGDYNYEFFDKKSFSKLTFTSKEIEEIKKLYEVWTDGNIKIKENTAVKIDLTNKGITADQIQNILGEWLFFVFEKLDINWQNFDSTCKITKEDNAIKISPTDKITKREEVDLWFGIKFDKTNFLYNAAFIRDLTKIEKGKQSLTLKWLYGWWDMDAELEYSQDLKTIKNIKLKTIWNEIQINDVNLNVDVKDEKDIHNLYVNVMRTIYRSLNISYMSKTWILDSKDWFQYDAKTSNATISYGKIWKIWRDKWDKYYESAKKLNNKEYKDISFLIWSRLVNPIKLKYADIKTFQFQGVWGLAAKFESSTKWSEAIWYDSTWWASYGIYQIATKTWGMSDFLKFCEKSHAGIYWRLNPKKWDMWRINWSFATEWKAIARDASLSKEFAQVQHDYIKHSHYDLAMSQLQNKKLVDMINSSKTLQEVMRSTAVQHGGTWASRIFNGVYREGMSEKELITAVYGERGTKFGRSTAQVRHSVQNRFVQEKAIALSMLANERKWQPGTHEQSPTTTGQPQVAETSRSRTSSVERSFSKLPTGTLISMWETVTIDYNWKTHKIFASQSGDSITIWFNEKRYEWKLPASWVKVQWLRKDWNGVILLTDSIFSPEVPLSTAKFSELLTKMAHNESKIEMGPITLSQVA